MSVFDLFDKSLPGDKKRRQLNLNYSEYQYFNGRENESVDKQTKNFWSFYVLILIVFAVLIAQLLHLQITQGSFNRILAQGNSLRKREILAPRGLIYDSAGKVLVNNDASFCLGVYPLDLPRKESDRQTFYQTLSKISQIPVAEIKQTIESKGFSQSDPIVLKENLDRDTALLLKVKTSNLPGVTIIQKPIRNYAQVRGLSQIIGYSGKVTESEIESNNSLRLNQVVGKEGLEKFYQNYLQGRDGINELEVDSQGRTQQLVSSLAPEPGNSLVLTIDGDFENYIAQTLDDALQSSHSTAGSVVAVSPRTGAVLGMVSLPTYDNNLFAHGISGNDYQKLIDDSGKPLFNRAIAGTYPSGSTIKPFVAAASLQEEIITANTTIEDTGEIDVGNYIYHDWKAHGLVDVRKAIAQSCDVFFYSLGGGWDKIKGLGIAKLDEYLDNFGFGKTLGIDLPGEAKGLVPTPQWKEGVKKEPWYLGDTYHTSIGQGDFLTTPLQLATGIGAIANGGQVLKPYLVSEIKDNNGNVVEQAQKQVLNKDFISEENIQIVREGMRQAVTSGTAQQFKDLPVAVAAKTGTAQFGDKDKTHAWMVAFAPYNDPQIAIIVLIEGGGEGYAVAGPVVKDVLNYYFNK